MKFWSYILVLLPFFGHGQQALLDSAISLQFNDPAAAIGIADRIIENERDQKLLSNAWEVKGIALWVKGDYAKAITSHQISLEIRKEIGFENGVAHSLNNLGLNYSRVGDRPTAIDHYMNGLDKAENLSDSNLMARILGNIGILYEEQDEDEKALAFQERCLEISEKANIPYRIGNAWNNIALIYLKKKEWARVPKNSQPNALISEQNMAMKLVKHKR